MSNALLTTKLHMPSARPDIVSRPRLLSLLDDSLRVKLTLISAPAGFGKSTLVANWLTNRRPRAAGLSLDEGDNDPVRFWSYVIAALQGVDPDIGGEAREILSATGLNDLEPAVITLMNDLSRRSDDLILILDDYHTIETPSIHDSLQLLLEHQPPTLHLMLLTRLDPPLRLARLRARRQMIEIRADALQFNDDEATVLMNDLMQLALQPEQIDALARRTEGWVTGLQLAGLSLQGQVNRDAFIHQFTGSHQYILDYLAEEVLHILPETHRRFLMQTAVLDRMCDGLCQAVTQAPDCQTIFDDVRARNLFLIPLDVTGEWFRYHHLFAEILRALLKREAADSVPALHLRAAAWHENEGYIEEAVSHTLHSGDMAQAKRLILQYWAVVVHQGHVATALHWLDMLPDEFNRDDPLILLARCWVLHLSGHTPAIVSYLEPIEQIVQRLESSGQLSPVQRDFILSQVGMMYSVLERSRGNPEAALVHAERAVEIVPPDILHAAGPAWNLLAAARMNVWDFDGAIEAFNHGINLAYTGGNLLSAFVSTFGLSVYLGYQGRLNEATEVCRTALERAAHDHLEVTPAAGLLHIALARIAFERNRIDDAEAYLNTGRRIARAGGFSEAMRFGRYTNAQIAALHGHPDAANQTFEEAERIIQAMADPYLMGELHREWARTLFLIGDVVSAQEHIYMLREKSALTGHPGLEFACAWMTVRLLIEAGQFNEALNTLETIIQRARQSNSRGELLRLLALQAAALSQINRHAEVTESLHEAIQLGESQGYVRRWLDAGAGIIPLLRAFRNDGSLSAAEIAYVDTVLSAWRPTTSNKPDTPQIDALLSPLSERELELLRLIDAGYSNQEIADHLVITLHTVKKHTSNIYSKLGVSSRTQALALAREYELI